MGRNIRSQRQGKGSSCYRATAHGTVDIVYPNYDENQRNSKVIGEVIDFTTDCGRTGILAQILFEDGKKEYFLAAEGMNVGQRIEMGKEAKQGIGNILPLSKVVEGTAVFNIERIPGDGGKLVKTNGSFGLIVSKTNERAFVKLPSGKILQLPLDCRATIGNLAGSGRTTKPMVKAGNTFHRMLAKSRKWHRNRGVKMNACDHPHGGASHHPGRSECVSRNAPPGRKVGHIASRRTGRRKK